MMAAVEQSDLETSTFEALAALAHRESGLQLVPEKRLMVQSRLRQRLNALRLPNFDAYTSFVQSEDGREEIRFMISALTTNVSQFFREDHHFGLMQECLADILRKKISAGERIRIWSAGCSNGQEPYSIAMALLHAFPELKTADFKILATDIDPRVIAFARRGQYTRRDTDQIPDEFQQEFFATDTANGGVNIVDDLKKFISFRELNLLHQWPMQQQFDCIFCRNVVIYFDVPTQEALWPRFRDKLYPHGLLFLGHSERIADPEQFGLCNAGLTAYATKK